MHFSALSLVLCASIGAAVASIQSHDTLLDGLVTPHDRLPHLQDAATTSGQDNNVAEALASLFEAHLVREPFLRTRRSQPARAPRAAEPRRFTKTPKRVKAKGESKKRSSDKHQLPLTVLPLPAVVPSSPRKANWQGADVERTAEDAVASSWAWLDGGDGHPARWDDKEEADLYAATMDKRARARRTA